MARNHSWHSWREKYVRNQQRFDELIDQYTAGVRHQKTLYGRYRANSVQVEVESEEDEDADLDQQPHKRKHHTPILVDSDIESVPPQKRARLSESVSVLSLVLHRSGYSLHVGIFRRIRRVRASRCHVRL
jgi:hypothetical protein